jgi:hypothetical protein
MSDVKDLVTRSRVSELAGRRVRTSPVALGPGAFLYLVATLVLVAGPIASAVLQPAVYHQWCVRYYIPSVEARFGFRSGRILIPGTDYRWLGVVEVTPGGALSRAGFRPGDIPVDHHGGETAFCYALESASDAEAGGYRRVNAINVSDWPSGRRATRELEIPRME